MKTPVDHILRPALPWRGTAAITECGYDATKVKIISRSEHAQRVKDYGQQRAAMLTCMTCSQTSARYAAWEEDPREAIEREVNWESKWRKPRGNQLRDELLAIEALIAAHPDEFKQSIADIQSRREWLERKAEKPKPEPVRSTWRPT
jgi:hypothetical protein